MQIITNWTPRNMLALCELPEKVRADFEYVDEGEEYTPRFVQYRGAWYDVFDTQAIYPVKPGGYTGYVGWAMRVHPGSPVALFDSIMSDSYFSGVLFRLVGDEQVVVARYWC